MAQLTPVLLGLVLALGGCATDRVEVPQRKAEGGQGLVIVLPI